MMSSYYRSDLYEWKAIPPWRHGEHVIVELPILA